MNSNPKQAQSVKEMIQEIKEKYPSIEEIKIEYSGSGDSFEDFYGLHFTPSNINIPQSDIEDLLWYCIDHSEADFNDECSKGSISIDCINETADIDNYAYETSTRQSGIIRFED